MHELSCAKGLTDLVNKEAEKAGAVKVRSVSVVIGKCSCITTEILSDYFALFCEGTAAEGAALHIIRTPGLIFCPTCQAEHELPDFRLICPVCSGRDVTLKSGREFYLESLEIES